MLASIWGVNELLRASVFTVHERPDPAAHRIDRAEELEFVKDGFVWGAALLPPIWLLSQREWVGALVYMACAMAVYVLLALLGVPESWIFTLIFAANLLVGLEASSIRRWQLNRMGWHEIGLVTGHTVAECERRFLESWLPKQPVITMATASPRPVSPPAPQPTRRGWLPFGKA